MIPMSARGPLTVTVRRSRISAGRLMSVVAAPDAPLALQRAVCVCALCCKGPRRQRRSRGRGPPPFHAQAQGLNVVRRMPGARARPCGACLHLTLPRRPSLRLQCSCIPQCSRSRDQGDPVGVAPQTTGGCSCVAGWWSFMKPGQRMEKQSLQAVRPTVILVTVKAAGPVKIFFSYLAR